MSSDDPILSVDDLAVEFATAQGPVYAVNHVSFALHRREVTALLGETGSGKSVTGRAILGLIDPAGRVTSGRILFRGVDLLRLDEREASRVRGSELTMVFQDARATLNPLIPVGEQVARVARYHLGLGRAEAIRRALDVMRSVGIPDAKRRLGMYPHQLSGGLNQRVMIAAAVICEPTVVVADEPTTGLDVTVQAQVVALLRRFVVEHDRACLFITHDIGVAADISDRVAVMYGGMIVEYGPTREVLTNPGHPYTAALLRSALPVWRQQELVSIPGTPHELRVEPTLCTFLERCPLKVERCHRLAPPLREPSAGHVSLCHLASERVRETVSG